MRNSSKAFITSLFACCYFLALNAQFTVKGEILDERSKEALIGASVVAISQDAGTISDWDGSFSLDIKSGNKVTLDISYIGYENVLVETDGSEHLHILLAEATVIIEGVEVKGQRISDKQKTSPLSIESLDIISIKETASSNFYDGLGSLKDVDLTTASLGFTIINTRGFNSTSPVRSLQIIDGVDNQSPGLNFSLGNFLGASELDINKVELIIGASSAFYGPNAFNGVISMQTKDPFFHEGLAVKMKIGERQLIEPSFRWANTVKNKNGLPFFAYKLNGSYMQAYDWEADNYKAVYGSSSPENNPGGYDAVNIYGDEFNKIFDYSENDTYPGLGTMHRKGYKEVDLVDYHSYNVKAGISAHFRLYPAQDFNSPIIVLSSNYGGGTTVYQGDNRFSLKNIRFYQHKIELQKRNKYFLRVYATHEDAGDSYDPYFTALKMQNYARSNVDWKTAYANYWNNTATKYLKSLDNYPKKSDFPGDPEGYQVALNMFLENHTEAISNFHQDAKTHADMGSILDDSQDFFEPGTQRFDSLFESITGRIARSEGGTRFFDRSALIHSHGEYKFDNLYQGNVINNIDLLFGANGRLYMPNSKGSILLDTMGRKINTYEYGIYGGGTFSFANNNLKLNTSVRLDKHQNFKYLLSPAASLVYTYRQNTIFRLSFSSAIRNPTLTEQYLFYNVGPATLLGNIQGVENLITVPSFVKYLNSNKVDDLEYFDVPAIQPEKVQTIEGGIRTTLWNQLYVDGGYYYSRYRDFIGYLLGIEAEYNFIGPTSAHAYRVSANATDIVTTQGYSIGLNYYFRTFYMLKGNYSWNKLNSQSDDPIIPAFNTPEHKYNLSLSGRDLNFRLSGIEIKNIGFNVQYKWIQGFLFEGSPQFTGFVDNYDLLDVQLNWLWKEKHTTFKIGASNVLNNKVYQTYGGPRVGRLAYISFTYDMKK